MEYNVAVVGANIVGKSSLVNMFVRNIYLSEEEYIPTIVDNYRKQVVIDEESCLIEIIDTSGDEIYDVLLEDQLRKCDGFICVFAVDNLDSFEKASYFITKIRVVKPNNSPIILVGNKSDCGRQKRQVDRILGRCRANFYSIPYIETSAKQCVNVSAVFLLSVRQIRSKKDESMKEEREEKEEQRCKIC